MTDALFAARVREWSGSTRNEEPFEIGGRASNLGDVPAEFATGSGKLFYFLWISVIDSVLFLFDT